MMKHSNSLIDYSKATKQFETGNEEYWASFSAGATNSIAVDGVMSTENLVHYV